MPIRPAAGPSAAYAHHRLLTSMPRHRLLLYAVRWFCSMTRSPIPAKDTPRHFTLIDETKLCKLDTLRADSRAIDVTLRGSWWHPSRQLSQEALSDDAFLAPSVLNCSPLPLVRVAQGVGDIFTTEIALAVCRNTHRDAYEWHRSAVVSPRSVAHGLHWPSEPRILSHGWEWMSDDGENQSFLHSIIRTKGQPMPMTKRS